MHHFRVILESVGMMPFPVAKVSASIFAVQGRKKVFWVHDYTFSWVILDIFVTCICSVFSVAPLSENVSHTMV